MAAVFNRYCSTSLRIRENKEKTMQIIIVEDEENIRKELKQLLQNAMYEVTTIESFSDVAGQITRMDAGSGFAGSESSGGVRICHLYEDPGVLGDSCDLSDQPNRFDG